MAMTKNTKGLLALLGVAVVAGGGWYGWQYYASSNAPAPQAQSAVADSKPVSMPASTVNQDKLVNEVLNATGMTRQLEQLPEQISGGMAGAPNSDKIPPEIARALEKIVVDSFSEEKIHAHLVAQLKEKFDQKRMQALVDDFSKPLVKRMVAMETTMGTPQDQAAFFNGLSAKPLPPTRVSALQQLDRATNASDLGVEIAMSSITAMTGAMVGNNPAEREAFDREMEKQRGPMMESVRNGTMGGMAYIYREASDADITAYAKIYETDHAKWFSAIAMDSLKQGIKNASKRTGERMVSLMKSKVAPQATAKGAAPEAAAPGVAQMPRPEAMPAVTSQAAVPSQHKRRKPAGDIKKCLALEDSRAIAKCAEQYR
jgi:hypothetical protein